MFSEACVSHSVHSLGMMSLSAWYHVPSRGGEGLRPEGGTPLGEGCIQGGLHLGGGLHPGGGRRPLTQYWHILVATAAVRTYPTRMHSC